MSSIVWAPLSRTDDQAQASAGRFISVSLDKLAGRQHCWHTHPVLGAEERKGPYEAVLPYLLWKQTGGLTEHELSLLLPF